MKKGFKELDLVLLFNSKLRLFWGKLISQWYGPFKVLKVFLHGAVEVWSKSTSALKVSGQHLKPYYVGEPIDKPIVHSLSDPKPS